MTTASTERFEELLAPHTDVLAAYVFRLIGHHADAEDLLQEVKLTALERLAALRSEGAFRSWLFTIATNACLDHLRKQKRWRPFSQPYIEEQCANDAARRQQVARATRDPAFSFDVREHISFCFSCVGRSLDPAAAAALILRDVLGFTNREAAQILDLTESVLRHHLRDARGSMKSTFEGMCSLVNKDGICRQCSSFRLATGKEKRGPALPLLSEAMGKDSWPKRLAVVREAHVRDGKSTALHEVLFALIKELESADKA